MVYNFRMEGSRHLLTLSRAATAVLLCVLAEGAGRGQAQEFEASVQCRVVR